MKFLIPLLLILSSSSLIAQHQEISYHSKDASSIPDWAQKMYSANPDPQTIIEAYTEYYQSHTFKKNEHTQYYKHWLRNITRDRNGLFFNQQNIDRATVISNENLYLQRKELQEAMETSNDQWQCIGPIDYDHDAAGRSYAPGSAHVYTIEQAPSNANTLYAGTATAGLYKSTDYGAAWTAVTPNLMVNSVRAVAIDFSNDQVVYFGGGGFIYKSSNGGTTWIPTGDADFQNEGRSANDIVMHPSNNNRLFLCAEEGLFQTNDGGTSWNLLEAGTWQELAFHPTNSNIIYAIKQIGDHTEFYKSTDSGVTWNLKINGWPGISSFSSSTFKALESTTLPLN